MFLLRPIPELSRQLNRDYKLFQNHFHSVDVQFHIFGMTHHGNLHWTIFGLDKGFSQYLIFSSVSRFPVVNFDALTLKNSV